MTDVSCEWTSVHFRLFPTHLTHFYVTISVLKHQIFSLRYPCLGTSLGVKVNTINIKRGEALGLGVSLNQAALSYVIGTDKSDYIAAG